MANSATGVVNLRNVRIVGKEPLAAVVLFSLTAYMRGSEPLLIASLSCNLAPAAGAMACMVGKDKFALVKAGLSSCAALLLRCSAYLRCSFYCAPFSLSSLPVPRSASLSCCLSLCVSAYLPA